MLQAQMNEDWLHNFIFFGINVGLYGIMCSFILSQDPLPSLDRVYLLLLQER